MTFYNTGRFPINQIKKEKNAELSGRLEPGIFIRNPTGRQQSSVGKARARFSLMQMPLLFFLPAI